MNPNDKKRFAAVMKGLSVNAGIEITDDVVRLYSKALKDFTIDDIEGAGVKILQSWEYNRMPPVAVILKHLRGESQPIEDKATVIANEIVAHLKHYGAGKFPDLHGDKIATHLMTRRWPYREWGSQLVNSEAHWWVKEFIEAYRAYQETDVPVQIEAPAEFKKLLEGIG